MSWSAYGLRKDWNQAKAEVAPWWGENSKEAYSSGLANLATALGNWTDSQRDKRHGRRLGFPRFKGERAGLSCRFTTGAFGLPDGDRRHVTLPRIGLVRTHESTRKLARHVERGTARIRSATVSYRSGRWLCSFSVEITRPDPAPVRPWGWISGCARSRRCPPGRSCPIPSILRLRCGVAPPAASGFPPCRPGHSDCGAVKTKLPLRVRVYRCDECGLVLDRDLNAARNLAALVGETAAGTSAASCAGTLNTPDGNPCQTHTVWAAGTATGRPAPLGTGQPRRRKATTA